MRSFRQPTYDRRDSSSWIEASGIVIRPAADDHEDGRHQRFVLDMRNGQTLLIAHNIDIAKHVPLGMGDRVQFRGRYEWNEHGGVVHWTHHDPHGAEEGDYQRHQIRIRYEAAVAHMRPSKPPKRTDIIARSEATRQSLSGCNSAERSRATESGGCHALRARNDVGAIRPLGSGIALQRLYDQV